eukprot:TRINITY_DN3356_c0_g1_i11.p1 TRINITY_DN3356_c0_g1~~TRINITY_DN3356_c0_g1_i11.p1  ORF type:complete len:590 (+),score=81.99 TRINITY_DN3356_c0_g1_i11:687-2456(+)
MRDHPQLMLNAGESVIAGESMTCLAAKTGSDYVIPDRVDWGADVEDKCLSGQSSLQIAAAQGNLIMAKALWKAGASTAVVPYPAQLARDNGHEATALFLFSHPSQKPSYFEKWAIALRSRNFWISALMPPLVAAVCLACLSVWPLFAPKGYVGLAVPDEEQTDLEPGALLLASQACISPMRKHVNKMLHFLAIMANVVYPLHICMDYANANYYAPLWFFLLAMSNLETVIRAPKNMSTMVSILGPGRHPALCIQPILSSKGAYILSNFASVMVVGLFLPAAVLLGGDRDYTQHSEDTIRMSNSFVQPFALVVQTLCSKLGTYSAGLDNRQAFQFLNPYMLDEGLVRQGELMWKAGVFYSACSYCIARMLVMLWSIIEEGPHACAEREQLVRKLALEIQKCARRKDDISTIHAQVSSETIQVNQVEPAAWWKWTPPLGSGTFKDFVYIVVDFLLLDTFTIHNFLLAQHYAFAFLLGVVYWVSLILQVISGELIGLYAAAKESAEQGFRQRVLTSALDKERAMEAPVSLAVTVYAVQWSVTDTFSLGTGFLSVMSSTYGVADYLYEQSIMPRTHASPAQAQPTLLGSSRYK